MTTTHRSALPSLQLFTAAVAAASCWLSCGAQALRFIPKSEMPQNDWISMDQNVQFLPADANSPESIHRAHRQLSNAYSNAYDSQPFADSTADYSSYQQAWRMLGFMIDCSVTNDGTQGSGDKNRQNGGGNAATGEGCQRYVVWAAYVDLNYQGGGIGEYQYLDRETGKWDTTSCNYASQNNNNNKHRREKSNDNNNNNNQNQEPRCAKMDCHLSDTHFTLLGFFKHPNYSDWFGQLFKHEGMCVWSSDEYSFMKNARKAWPNGCTTSSTTRSDGSPIYYDLKPLEEGRITVGLYTDTRCVEEYKSTGSSDPITAENVVGNLLMNNRNSHDNKDNQNNNNNNNNAYSEYTLSQAQSMWDSAFDAWTVCQPCVAYDLNNVGYNADDDASKGSSYGTYTYGYDDYYYQYYYGNKGADFDCYDDAGYTNVNQCMKFMAKTTMYTATYRDLALATAQGTLVDNPVVAGYSYASKSAINNTTKASRAAKAFVTCCFFIASAVILVNGVFKFLKARREMRNGPAAGFSMKESLVMA